MRLFAERAAGPHANVVATDLAGEPHAVAKRLDPLLADRRIGIERFRHAELDGKHLQTEAIVHPLQSLDAFDFTRGRVVSHRPPFHQFHAVEFLLAGEVQDLPDGIDPVVVLARRHEAIESDGRFPAGLFGSGRSGAGQQTGRCRTAH